VTAHSDDLAPRREETIMGEAATEGSETTRAEPGIRAAARAEPPARPRTAEAADQPLDTWVLPEQKILFVAVAKNASTSLKWLLADITGQDRERIFASIGLAPTRWQAIHGWSLWSGVSRLHELDAHARAEISPENGWFVFTVVRDPWVRTWSAWQSKFLIGNPTHTFITFRDEPWLPRRPKSGEDVVEDFARFVRVLDSGESPQLNADPHFEVQVDCLREDLIPYTRIYDMSEMPVLLADLEAHLAGVGQPQKLTLGRENATPLPIAGRVFGPEVRAALERVYARDLRRFGTYWDFEKTLAREADWGPEAFADIAARAAAYQRIADLSQEAKRVRSALRGDVKKLRGTIADLEKKNGRLETSLAAAKKENRELRGRVGALESALHSRTLRGFPRAAARRIRRLFTRG